MSVTRSRLDTVGLSGFGWRSLIKTEEEGSSFSQAVILDDEFNEIHQLKQFPFSSEYARSSVLVRTVSQDGETIGDLEVLVKGAPEFIRKLCHGETIPSNYSDRLESLSKEGYRILAMGRKLFPGWKPHKVMAMSREQLESDLEFVGFLIFKNNLKPESAQVIKPRFPIILPIFLTDVGDKIFF